VIGSNFPFGLFDFPAESLVNVELPIGGVERRTFFLYVCMPYCSRVTALLLTGCPRLLVQDYLKVSTSSGTDQLA
jgi:hypothetical protein